MADGSVLTPLDEPSARAAIARLEDAGVEAIAVCLLHAYRNPAHERALDDLCAELLPGRARVLLVRGRRRRSASTSARRRPAPTSTSCRSWRAISTTSSASSSDLGIPGALLHHALGGRHRHRRDRPSACPSASSSPARRRARWPPRAWRASWASRGCSPSTWAAPPPRPASSTAASRSSPREFEVARVDRFKKGSGLPIRVPVHRADRDRRRRRLASPRVDRMGLLKVGPDSAGADPGPACYAQRRHRRPPSPTPISCSATSIPASSSAAACASTWTPRGAPSRSSVAKPLGLSLTEAAWGIHRVVNENMAGAARMHGIERGKDLRAYPALRLRRRGPGARLAGRAHPQGAARPRALRRGRHVGLRAPGRAARLRLRPHRAAAPRRRGLGADQPASSTRWKRRGGGSCAARDVPDGAVRIRRTAEMHYTGQGHEVEVEVPPGALGAGSLDAITASFETAYRALYSRTPHGRPHRGAQLARAWSRAPCPRSPSPVAEPAPGSGAAKPVPKATRKAYFPEARGYVDTPVYDRYALVPGRGLRRARHHRGARVHHRGRPRRARQRGRRVSP